MNIITRLIAAISVLFLFAYCNNIGKDSFSGKKQHFNHNWEFVKDTVIEISDDLFSRENALNWKSISIPHTAKIEPLVIKGEQWQGQAYYRKFFTIPEDYSNKHIAIKFEGAMQVAKVYLNGKLLHTNKGGYLPFYVDITEEVKTEEENCIIVSLDNTDNQQIAPGKPTNELDFNIFSGIYRNVWLIAKNKLHITDPIDANKVAGGGVFVSYNEVSSISAGINIAVDVKNNSIIEADALIKATVLDKEDNIVLESTSGNKLIKTGESSVLKLDFILNTPQLWSPDFPYLYKLKIELIENDKIVDVETLKIGVRGFEISPERGLVLNGEPIKLRGTNRHQEYPYIGYAISDNANYRDAYKIKEAGFNFVRLSHYPHSKSFINACDELGLLVMDAIPGWQFFGDSVFQRNALSDIRKMIRRDRNHPSIIIWEASLNESGMDSAFMQKAHEIVHEEFPGKNVYSSGWIDQVYDIYIPARQHAKPPYYWNKYNKDKALLIAEYGDWEYYAQNAGFNQKAFKNLSEDERNSRQFRGFGQKRLLQQALNYQESHNHNLNGNSLGDANWLMFDYNRGYASDIEASGIMDIFRLPKFAYYFYKSQLDIDDNLYGNFNTPVAFIANFYYDPSFLEIKVYSNCDEIELLRNGTTIEKRKPDNDELSSNLKHPPFTFNLKEYVPGEITAKGYVKGKQVVVANQKSPLNPAKLKIWVDESGKKLEKACNDVVFIYASVVDENGTVIPEATNETMFNVEGDASLIGLNPVSAEAGIATVLLKAGMKEGEINITASSQGLKSANLRINVQ